MAIPRFVYLASQSPRRTQLLDQIGVAHRLLLPTADEDTEALEVECSGESPDDYVLRVTLAKYNAARTRLAQHQQSILVSHWPAAPILCADTTVVLEGDILGKPRDAADAVRILSRLSGTTHRVLTAVVLDGQARVSVSTVQWRELAALEIENYVQNGEPMGKAGAYAIQSRAAAWTISISGSYSGIMGLPLFETAELLRQHQWSE